MAELEVRKAADAVAKARQAIQESKVAQERCREERLKELAEKAWLEEEEKARVEAEEQARVQAKERAQLKAAKAAEVAPIMAISFYYRYFCSSSVNTSNCRMKLKWS